MSKEPPERSGQPQHVLLPRQLCLEFIIQHSFLSKCAIWEFEWKDLYQNLNEDFFNQILDSVDGLFFILCLRAENSD